MDNPLTYLPSIVFNIQASRFVSAAGMIMLIYDHLLTLDDEVQYIWSAKWTTPKILFLIVRYMVPTVVILNTYQLSGISQPNLSDKFCRVWFAAAGLVGLTTIGIGNYLVLLKLWTLWERNKSLMIWTLFLFIVTQISTVICTIVAITEMIPSLHFYTELKLCALENRHRIFIMWTPGIAFEVMVFITTWWNALDRPRNSYNALTHSLYRDGFTYFFTLFFLRLINLMLALLAPLSLLFLGVFFIWCTTTLTVTRLIINLRRLSAKEGHALPSPVGETHELQWSVHHRQDYQ